MVILGLGSNVGDREAHLTDAIRMLGESALATMTFSPVYESAAVLKPDAPEEWNRPFLNMAVMGETHLTPIALLRQLKCIENKLGRSNRNGIWAPREIDIDILAFDAVTIDTQELTIPHSRLCERSFALVPFVDLAPNWFYPDNGSPYAGKTAYALAKQLADANLTKTDIELGYQRVA